MFEFLQWVLGGFWRFTGFIIILGLLIKGIVALAAVILNRNMEAIDD